MDVVASLVKVMYNFGQLPGDNTSSNGQVYLLKHPTGYQKILKCSHQQHVIHNNTVYGKRNFSRWVVNTTKLPTGRMSCSHVLNWMHTAGSIQGESTFTCYLQHKTARFTTTGIAMIMCSIASAQWLETLKLLTYCTCFISHNPQFSR